MTTVLITTSGTGSRLGKITEYTNKALVPVGDKFALSHIIDSYDNTVEFVITLGYKGNLVKEFCTLAYPLKRITFVDVDRFEGPGTSLIYSILQAKNYLQKPFIFHCCDTIITERLPNFDQNTVVVSKDSDYLSYSSILTERDSVKVMNPKGYETNDFCYIGIAYYKDYNTFWTSAEKLYNENIDNRSLSDIHVIQCMLTQHNIFSYHTVSEFFDTGNLQSYKKCLNHFHQEYDVLTKYNESLCFLPGKVVKFQADATINRKRYERAMVLQDFIPKILGATDNFISMEFVRGFLLADSMKLDEISRLLEWAQKNLWSRPSISQDFLNDSREFYLTKTKQRIQALRLDQEEAYLVNGIHVGSIQECLDSIDVNLLLTDTFTLFHGDFILDNIMKDLSGNYVLLDWRHEFGKQITYGDMYYDLAKLRHNIIFNHKNILNNLFHVSQDGTNVTVDLKCNYMLLKQLEDFDSFLEKYHYNKKKVMVLTALVWLNMAPLYEGRLQNFLFYFGKLHLYLAVSDVRP